MIWNVIRVIMGLSLLLVTSGCVWTLLAAPQDYWQNDTLSSENFHQTFNKDNYECMRQSQQRQSNSAYDAYGGQSNSGTITNYDLFNACMYAKSYYLVRK